MRLIILLVSVMISCFGAPRQAAGQIVGPGLKQGDLELGAWRAFFTLDMLEKSKPYDCVEELRRDDDDDRAGLMLRYGITNRIYALLNFGAANWVWNKGEPDERNYFTTVLGIGGGVHVTSLGNYTVRLGGEYNDVLDVGRDYRSTPFRAREARIAATIGRAFKNRWLRLDLSAGPLFFSYRWKAFDRNEDVIRGRNRHPFSMVTAATIEFFNRVNGGLELTLGAITDWRWRLHVRL